MKPQLIRCAVSEPVPCRHYNWHEPPGCDKLSLTNQTALRLDAKVNSYLEQAVLQLFLSAIQGLICKVLEISGMKHDHKSKARTLLTLHAQG